MSASRIQSQRLSQRDWSVVSSAIRSSFDETEREGWLKHFRSNANHQLASRKILLRTFILKSRRRRRPAVEFAPALQALGFTNTQITALADLAII